MSFGNPQIVLSTGNSILPTPQQGPPPKQNLTAIGIPSSGSPQNLIRYNVPNDNQFHTLNAEAALQVIVTTVGGSLAFNWVYQGLAFAVALIGSAQSANASGQLSRLADPGSLATIIWGATTGGSSIASVALFDVVS